MDFSNSTDIGVASSPGADVSGVALFLLCQLFGLVKGWLHAGGVSINNNGYDDDQSVEKEMMFSNAECQRYSSLTRMHSSDCENKSMVYDYVIDQAWYARGKFMKCLTYHFMTEMGANSSCTNNSVWSENNTNCQSTMPLLSKDHLFLSFMANTLNMTSICRSSNDTLMSDTDTNATVFSSDNCNRYWVKYRSTENRCVHNTSAMNIDRQLPYGECLFYRFMKSLGADSGCSEHISLFESCAFYKSMMRTVVPTIICIIGLIGNSISLVMLCRGLVETPTNYQVQWLAVVDITFIGTHWFTITLYNVMGYAHFTSDLYWHGIEPVLYVCLYPVWFVARSCTVWLTVFIGVYRYLAVCKPYSNVYSHVMLHGQKYVKLIVALSIIYNFSVFISYSVESYKEDEEVYVHYNETGLISNNFNVVYYYYVTGVLVVCLPIIILCFATVNILVELRKRKKKKSSMQTSSTPQTSITAVLITILITFIICHISYFLYWAILLNIPSLKDECGNFSFYLRDFVWVGLLLNSSANGFIYFFMNKNFRDAFFSRCKCKGNDGTESIEMGAVHNRLSTPSGEIQWNHGQKKMPTILFFSDGTRYRTVM